MGEGATTTTRSIAPEPGEIVDSKFRVERRIGEGGMGLVLQAVHLKLDERVALKFLRPDALERADVVARFAQEARAAVKLKSEHVARVIDVGEHRGLPFMVMELLEGNDLEELLAKNGPMNAQDAVELLIQACEGINEAHAKGIVHRDIKPANLFVAQSGHGWGTLKVLDFGISKASLTGKVSDADLASRKTTSVMGSPYYMSPEQLRSTRDVDLRTDIWALGVVLFELVTGRTAFEECDDFAQLVVQILERDPRKLKDFLSHPPHGLQPIIDRCLEKDRTKRYQSAAELAIALVPFAKTRDAATIASRAAKVTRASGIDPNLHTPWSMPPPPSSKPELALAKTDLTLSPEVPKHPTKDDVMAPTERAPAPKKPLKWIWPVALAAVVLVGGGFVAMRGSGKTEPPRAALQGPEPPAAANPPVMSPPPAVAPPPAVETAAAVASAAVSATASASITVATSPPHATPKTLPRSTPRPPTPPAASGTSKGTDLEIRRER